MKTNIILTVLLAIVLSSCYYPEYLSRWEDIDTNQYGSYIEIVHKDLVNIRGELIAIDSSRIVVLEKESNKCITVPLADTYSFSISYAKSPNYDFYIPLLLLLPVMNGGFSIFTMPAHLIVGIAANRNAYKFRNTSLTNEQMRMFARFPQGIPDNVDIADIHR